MKKFFGIVIIALIILVVGGYFYLSNWYDGINDPVGQSSEKVRFEIAQGESSDSIGGRLEEAGLIRDDLLFKLYLRRSGRAGELQAGEFDIAQNLTMVEVVDVLSNAVELDTVRVTLIEGWGYTRIADELDQAFTGVSGTVFSKQEFLDISENPDNVLFSSDLDSFVSQYKPEGNSLEGFLYPNTYEFANDVTTKDVVERLINEFMNKTTDIEKGEDFYDTLVLASIVEREAFTDEERDEIASVFLNRLEINMALESDATVNYATGVDNPRTTNAERAIDSPYNTYMYPGLPPTPINNPRIQSIEAVLDPADTDYYFFLHEQDGSGQVHFAKTLSEHNANVARYLD